jgi:transposase
MGNRFRNVDRDTPYMFPPSVQDWLPANHLARFVVGVVEKLDLGLLRESYSGRGSDAYPPSMMVSLLFYGYATGVFSSRKLERATYDSVAFRYIAANQHPDHDTIANFRQRFLEQLKPLFLQILLLAREMGLLKLGKVSLDGTKVKANASKHNAMSWGHMLKLEKQLKQEVADLMEQAEAADTANASDGMDIPDELSRREKLLEEIEKAKVKLTERAAERDAAEKAAYEEKVASREAKKKETGKRPRGPKPKPPQGGGVRDKDQINLSDEESRIMLSGGGFEQCYNAQATVETESLLVVGAQVSQSPNDKKELSPALTALMELPEELGHTEAVLADNGYFSQENVDLCVQEQVTPYISLGREKHHPSPEERLREPDPVCEDANALERMQHRLKTREGKAIYAERKSTVEPVFGIIKSVMGFRQFMLRGLKAVQGEWNLVTLAWNLKRMHKMQSIRQADAVLCA